MFKHKKIALADPDIRDEDIQKMVSVLKSGMLIQGKEVIDLEQKLASFIGVKHCIAASNGTATLHLCLHALDIKKGDEVIVPAFSYVATANVVELAGAKPIFADIYQTTNNIDVEKIEELINEKTKAIIPVHEFGLACDIHQISHISNKYNIPVIEDAACALGAMIDQRKIGSFGLAGSFSFHPRKAITSGEGGLISTNDDLFAEKLRILRNHGISYKNNKMEFVDAGFNYRMTDFQAALLNSQYERFQETLAKKGRLARLYMRHLDFTMITLPVVPEGYAHTWQTFHVLLDSQFNRDQIIDKLKEKNIYTNYGAQCIPIQEFYLNKYKLPVHDLYPNSLRAFQHGLALPLHEKLNEEDIIYVSQTLNQILKTC